MQLLVRTNGKQTLYQARDGSFVLVHADGSGERALPRDIRVRKLALSPDETKAFFEETEGYLSKSESLTFRAVRPGDQQRTDGDGRRQTEGPGRPLRTVADGAPTSR
jgi:hypothetical protein